MSTEKTPLTDAFEANVKSGLHTRVFKAALNHARTLETRLQQSEAGAAALREFVEEAAGVQMTLASGRVLKKAELLSTTAGADILARLAKAEAEVAILQRNIAGAVDNEQERWQDALDELFVRLIPDATLDGGGCESGDPLDFSISEISQAIQHVEAKADAARTEADAKEQEADALAKALEAIGHVCRTGIGNRIGNIQSLVENALAARKGAK